jgi:hypothetical protein
MNQPFLESNQVELKLLRLPRDRVLAPLLTCLVERVWN